MSEYYNIPTQVVFTFDNGTNRERCAGIAYCEEIICAECGCLFDITDEGLEIEIEKELPWISLCEEICPDEDYGEIEDEKEEE